MKKVYILEISLEQGLTNSIVFLDKEAAETELEKLKAVMGTFYIKNSEEVIQINGPAEKVYVVARRVQTAAVVDKLEHHNMQNETTDALQMVEQKRHIEHTVAFRKRMNEEGLSGIK